MFARACAGCHGDRARATSTASGSVGAINDPAFLALISDQALRRTPSPAGPTWGCRTYAATAGRPADFRPLTSAEIDDLVALLAYWRQGGPADGK